MAYTIVDTPDCVATQPYLPAFNKTTFVVRSTPNNEQENFKYIYQIKDVTNASTIATVRQFPRPDGDGLIDVRQFLKPYTVPPPTVPLINAADNGFVNNTGALLRFKVDFGEEYGDPVSSTLAVVSSSEYYAWPAAIPFTDFPSFDSDTFTLGSITKQCLTTAPSFYVAEDQLAWLYFLHTATATTALMQIQTYNVNNTLLGTYTVANGFSSITSSVAGRYLRVTTGAGQLNGLTLASGTQPIITSDVDHYAVRFATGVGAATSIRYNYYIGRNCRYEGKRLTFRNRYGGFDSHFFPYVSHDTYTPKHEHYQKTLGRVDSGQWVTGVHERGLTSFHSTRTKKTKCVSAPLTDDQYAWLEQLVTSPEVYEQQTINGVKKLIPVKVLTSSFEAKTQAVERGPSVVEIEYEQAYTETPYY